jgi:hypothetical protein
LDTRNLSPLSSPEPARSAIYPKLPQPPRVRVSRGLRPHSNGLGAIRTSEYAANADHNQISQKMLTIDRAAWVFQIVEILKDRNGIVVCHHLHERALRNHSLIANRKAGF